MINVQSSSIKTEFQKVIDCDFTTSYNWFTYKTNSWWNNPTYWRDGNWLYWTDSSAVAFAFKIPSSIYSIWNPKKIIITWKWTRTNWIGLSYNADTKVIRHYNRLRIIWWTQNNGWTSISAPTNTDWSLTIDFENKIISSTISSEVLAITDNAISAFNTDWSSGNVNVCLVVENWTTHIKNAKFYFN